MRLLDPRLLALLLPLAACGVGRGVAVDSASEGSAGTGDSSPTDSGPTDSGPESGSDDEWSEDECCDGQHWEEECESDWDCNADYVCEFGECVLAPACGVDKVPANCGDAQLHPIEECEGDQDCMECASTIPAAHAQTFEFWVIQDADVDPVGNFYLLGLDEVASQYSVRKFSPAGEPVWESPIDVQDIALYGLAVDASGAVSIAGHTGGPNTWARGLAPDGSVAWIETPQPGLIDEVALLSDGTPVFVGRDGDASAIVTSRPGGNVGWTQTEPLHQTYLGVAVDSTDRIFAVGFDHDGHGVLAVHDSSGSQQWTAQYVAEEKGGEVLRAVAYDPVAQEIVVGGESNGGPVLAGFNEEGELAWDLPCLGGAFGTVNEVRALPDGRYAVAAWWRWDLETHDRPWLFVTDAGGSLSFSRAQSIVGSHDRGRATGLAVLTDQLLVAGTNSTIGNEGFLQVHAY